MTLYDAAMSALAQRKAIRRPSMPPGLSIVPVLTDDGERMTAFIVEPNAAGKFPQWYPSLDDLVAQDWHVAHWKLLEVRCCG